MDLGISVLLRPKVERHRRELVHQGFRKAVFRKVNRLDIGLAGIAALHPNMGKAFSRKDRKLRMFFLAASRADYAAKFPFRQTESAQQTAPASITLLAKHSQHGLSIAERAPGSSVALRLQLESGADKLGIGLQEGKGQELFGRRRRLARGGPHCVQKIGPVTGRPGTQFPRDLREAVGSLLLNHLEKAGLCRVRILPVQNWARRPLFALLTARRGRSAARFPGAFSLNSQKKILLEAGQVPVEGENLFRKGILGGEFFGAMDPVLPGTVGHRLIIEPRAGGWQLWHGNPTHNDGH